MPTIADFAAQLLAGPPKPVICLDTCDILEVVQCLDWEKSGGNSPRPVTCIDAATRLTKSSPARAEEKKTGPPSPFSLHRERQGQPLLGGLLQHFSPLGGL